MVAIVGPSVRRVTLLLSILRTTPSQSTARAIWRVAPPPDNRMPLTFFVFQDLHSLHGRGCSQMVPLLHSALNAQQGAHAIINDALRRTSLSDFASTYPKQLSAACASVSALRVR